MPYLHAMAAGHADWASYAVTLIASVAPGVLILFLRRGFSRRGFGGRRGSFGVLRILFVLLFTTILGPIVLVALLAFIAYSFYINRRRR
ncbi:MAG: hypothetical protein ACR2HO_10445 [Rubrobacteraceae bacterium]|nr:hypothetical protein [Rubrobacter sp.]